VLPDGYRLGVFRQLGLGGTPCEGTDWLRLPKEELIMAESKLDPTTAGVFSDWVWIGNYPEGDWNVGRGYFWYDPTPREPAINDDDFRRQHPEYDDREWNRLLREALKRGHA
jgi:hypothetical protein